MFRKRPGVSATFVFFLSLITSGCAGGFLTRPDHSAELPKDLPKEMRDRFEIKDVAPAPAPSSAPAEIKTVAAEKSEKKKRRKRKRGTTVSAPSGAISYPYRRPENDPLQVGEQHVFEITYFGVAAGEFTMEVLPFKMIGDRRVYHVRGNAVSSSVFSLFYRLNDTVETFIDYDGLFSHRFHIILDETKQTRDSLELFDSEKKQTFYWNRWNHKDRAYVETKEFAPIEPFSQDSLSALLYLRTVPLPPGKVFSFPVVSEAKGWEAVITVVRREYMDTPFGRVRTVVLKPETRYQGILQKKGDSYLWLTDDATRAVVRLEAKVKIGTVVAALKSYKAGNPAAALAPIPQQSPLLEPTPLPSLRP